ncbi:hypothetical protein LJR225_000407 [Phenylobacterium sp. LjRoot225]|uniref:hypothetical protein n=1 Tax=Phenylobacterium sp. LjRoot225 TaxID=3342285 RepID=UPI003ED0EADC
MVISIDSSMLLGYYQAKAGLPVTYSDGTTSSVITPKVAPTAPWTSQVTPQQASANVTAALAGHKIIDENAAKLDLSGASADYKKLFALYQGLGTLSDMATQIKASGVSSISKTQLQKAFLTGMSEMSSYISSADFDKLRLVQGDANTSAKSTLTVPKAATQYITPPLATSATDATAAFEGDVRFNIKVTRVNQTYDIPIDLSQMPEQTRSVANVVNYVNDQLSAAGVETRFGTSRTAGVAQEIKVGTKTVTLPAGPDQWALKVTIGTSETVNFSAPQTAGAVYLAQQVGDADPDDNTKTSDSTIRQQLLKFQTDTQDVAAPLQGSGQANWVDGRVFAKALDSAVGTVHAQTVGPDGSVYMLADVTGTVAGQGIKGTQDVALMKYDAAGKLIYTRTLGAASTATGLSLAVSADGKVAVGGSVSGALNGSTDGALNSGTTGSNAGQADSFVTLYDDDGQELWTQRRGARQDDQVNQVAFGADGTVYVAGQTKSAMPGGGAAQGDWDGYIEAFATDANRKVSTLFTQGFGTTGADKPKGMVIDGTSIVTASVEGGRAVLRRFDISSGAPVETANRDLGDLEGGDIAGLALDSNGQLVIAGTTANPQLSVDTVSSAASGGTDAFAARIAADLSINASDRLAYYGGSGDDKASALAVSNGKVWIAGTAGTDLPGEAPVGTQDGFLANLDVDSGAVDWSRRFTGTSGKAAPTAIAIAPTGSSVLDRLGLPSGDLTLDESKQLSAVSALRAGDQFTVSKSGAPASTVTIDQGETFETLMLKIQRASNFSVKMSVVATTDGQKQLKLEPAYPGAVVTFGPGKGDKDGLSQLGIPEGVLRATTTNAAGATVPADGKSNIYGLGLESDLNLSNADQISHAMAVLANAQGMIRTAYKDLVAAATPKSQLNAAAAAAALAKSGAVPAYMTNQISNYQAALDRLVGDTTTTTTDPTLTLFGITS